MAEEEERIWNELLKMNYRFNDKYSMSYLTKETYERAINSLGILRKNKWIDSHTYHIIFGIYKHYHGNVRKIKDLEAIEPRKIAQQSIGRKKIRNFIFKRDNNECLCCGSNKKLQIDHIIPINRGGENKISNLQTLCNSCNSSKSDKYKDFRHGGR